MLAIDITNIRINSLIKFWSIRFKHALGGFFVI